ncbi:GntR family transcriptional regulator [Mumia sp. zg.B53]|uniref:GntR family transcriptional regulator n=1 Tax=unclassified Mumia TaxID=2621872 RepID=UPI001C6E98DF|nr:MULTISPECIES: GntR family transcriptional regulator [unclassified Mumia]MBW9207024.1 GntR family transcriptional regulator [Mumia sp. zg.B17]MBW9210640.1 GntR family transcriptional regulator [Mumia sp. zg.B21]MBW9215253.1 GntR family transcriptional regulator [Mumia sp. zg.B53]MDD9348861.1 GntR family transcriptional regulator [Mumia sp.]
MPTWTSRRIEPGHSLREQIEESLTAAIVTGLVEPHELLTVPVLASQYEVSATPVREAMLNLARRGFVVPVRNKGFRVREVGRDELSNLVRTRRLLECPTMLDVAERFTAADRPAFDALVVRVRDAADARDFPTYVRADKELHLGLLALLGNPILVEVVGNLRDQTRTVGIAAKITREQLRASIDEHEALLDFLEAGDGAAASELMSRHIGHVLGWWSGVAEDTTPSATL